jgi:thiamine-phosphate pyrophosphorylase
VTHALPAKKWRRRPELREKSDKRARSLRILLDQADEGEAWLRFAAPILLFVAATPTARARLETARLYLVTPAAPAAGPLDEFLPRVLEAGVDIVQLREKDMEARRLLRAAEVARRRTLEFGALFVVNDRVDVALAAGADGVHLGQDDLPPEQARRQAGPAMLIGLSTHARAQVTAARGTDADYIAVGPVYPTPTKPGRPAVGVDLVRFAARPDPAGRSIPVFAIGGIDVATLPAVLEAGASRVCVLRALTESTNPAQTARELRAVLAPDGSPVEARSGG